MKFNYYKDTDSLYIELSVSPSVDTKIIANGVQADFDKDGHLVGFDIDNASKLANLSSFEIMGLGPQLAQPPVNL